LLSLHRAALAAELEACWHRADFYWSEFHAEFRRLSQRPEVWQATLAAVAPDRVPTDPDAVARWRRRLVDEVFIAVHWALANGRLQHVEEPTPDDRAFLHV